MLYPLSYGGRAVQAYPKLTQKMKAKEPPFFRLHLLRLFVCLPVLQLTLGRANIVTLTNLLRNHHHRALSLAEHHL